MAEITVRVSQSVSVRYLRAFCGVRYWEDATVNGEEDADGSRIPLRDGDVWNPTIDLETGRILDWPQGTTADIHYKVCDDGSYDLLDADKKQVAGVNGYVIGMMCPANKGSGDYVIMKVNADGYIENFRIDLSPFESEEP